MTSIGDQDFVAVRGFVKSVSSGGKVKFQRLLDGKTVEFVVSNPSGELADDLMCSSGIITLAIAEFGNEVLAILDVVS